MNTPILPNTWYAHKKDTLDIVYIDGKGIPYASPNSTLELNANPNIQQTLHEDYQPIKCIAGHFTSLEDEGLPELARFISEHLERSNPLELDSSDDSNLLAARGIRPDKPDDSKLRPSYGIRPH
ncbi:hypothetical protein GOV12_06480 [Candidatus Pacearchaeota archaeon]|nr:hypothetical protein [Candidatus Pacearchaeota archaeon]